MLAMVRQTTLTTGNLHINISAELYEPAVEDAIEPYIYEWVQGVRYVLFD